MPDSIPGLVLCEHFFREAVAPLVQDHFADLTFSAARWGHGSEVLGFDSARSMDHHWGPRVTLFLKEQDHHLKTDIVTMLANRLPFSVQGIPTNFATPEIDGGSIQETRQRPIHHGVEVTTVSRFLVSHLGFDASEGVGLQDWLLTPSHVLRTIRSGPVFHDGLGQLSTVESSLDWYPDDIWYYLLANQWRRIDQEEPFMARCGDVGDELGSRIVATRLITELMNLCFLMEKQYRPYNKWLGTAFQQLRASERLLPVFGKVLDAPKWREREGHLSRAYAIVGELHNGLDLTEFIQPSVSNFFNRPYLVPHAARYVEALRDCIRADNVKALPAHVGALFQYADSTDVQSNVALCREYAHIYQ